MHCYAFVTCCISKTVPYCFRRKFRMHCYAFVILYLNLDGPLRRSSECIAMLSEVKAEVVYLKCDGPCKKRGSECIAMLSVSLTSISKTVP